MKRFFYLFFLLFLYLPSLANDGIDANCEFADGEYYQANWFVRNDVNSQRLVLLDWQTGAMVKVLEQAFSTEEFALYNWSPNCRYIAGRIGDFHDTTLAIWDTVEGRRLVTWEHVYLYAVSFSPQNEQVLVETRAGAFLWTFANDSRVQLTDTFRCYGRSFEGHAWHYAHRLFIAVEADYTCRYAPGPIHIYNMDTGAELGTIYGANFRIFGTNRLVNYSYQTGHWQTTAGIYDLPSLALVDTVEVGPHYHVSDFTLTSDDHYFIVNEWGIRVYDLFANSDVFMQNSDISSNWQNLSLDAGVLTAFLPDSSQYRWSVETGEALE